MPTSSLSNHTDGEISSLLSIQVVLASLLQKIAHPAGADMNLSTNVLENAQTNVPRPD